MAGVVSKSYCEAIFALAKEDQKLDLYKEQLCLVADNVKSDCKYRTVMNHPKISKAQKKELLENIYGTTLDHMLLNFLKLLVDKNRFQSIDDITKEFVKSYNIENKIQVVYVQSACALKPDERDRMKETLETKLQKKVELVCSVNEELMAGIRMKINDQMIDNTAYSRLERLKKQVVVSEANK